MPICFMNYKSILDKVMDVEIFIFLDSFSMFNQFFLNSQTKIIKIELVTSNLPNKFICC